MPRAEPDVLAAPEAGFVELVSRHERDDLRSGRVVQLDFRVAAEKRDAHDHRLDRPLDRLGRQVQVVRPHENVAERLRVADEGHDELCCGLVVELARAAHLLEFAVVDDGDLIGDLHCLVLIVRDEYRRDVDDVVQLAEPLAQLDARVRAELREWLRQLHDVVLVTKVFVTHDQDEAMEISDQIAVINHGSLEQVGSPRELYDEPATQFVMTFVGDAQPMGDVLVRPHDLELSAEPVEGAIEAMIVRVTLLGRDAKVELHDTSGAVIVALITRDEFDSAGLWRGQNVWLSPKHERVFETA